MCEQGREEGESGRTCEGGAVYGTAGGAIAEDDVPALDHELERVVRKVQGRYRR